MITTAILLRALAIDTLGDGIVFGFVVSIGYLIAQTLNMAINPNFPRLLLYTLLNGRDFIVCTVVASVILTLWQ